MTSKHAETPSTLDEIRCAVAVINDKKGVSISVLDMRGKSPVVDYMILATGTSNPHIKAIKTALDKTFKDAGIELLGEDRDAESGWLIVDAFDFMIHLQTEEMRDFYRLDLLWKDAEIIEV